MSLRKYVDIVESAGIARTRVHNSTEPLRFRRNRVYQQQDGRKPVGFWWSFDQDWHDLVRSLKPKGKRVGSNDYRVEIDHGVCRVASLLEWSDILDFTVRFGTTPAPGGRFFWQSGDQSRYDPSQDDMLASRNRCRVGQIAWGKVAEQYDAIELPDYKHNDPSRPAAEWLDIDWHVASGCAWKLDGLRLFHRTPAASTG